MRNHTLGKNFKPALVATACALLISSQSGFAQEDATHTADLTTTSAVSVSTEVHAEASEMAQEAMTSANATGRRVAEAAHAARLQVLDSAGETREHTRGAIGTAVSSAVTAEAKSETRRAARNTVNADIQQQVSRSVQSDVQTDVHQRVRSNLGINVREQARSNLGASVREQTQGNLRGQLTSGLTGL